MTDPLTAWLDEMEAKAKAATPGRRTYLKSIQGECTSVALLGGNGLTRGQLCSVTTNNHDAAYIAALRAERERALEDAAKVAYEECKDCTSECDCAQAIRTLKEREP